MKAEKLDELFDSGEDISEHLDLTSAKRIGTQPKKVNVNFPEWIVNALDIEAKKNREIPYKWIS